MLLYTIIHRWPSDTLGVQHTIMTMIYPTRKRAEAALASLQHINPDPEHSYFLAVFNQEDFTNALPGH